MFLPILLYELKSLHIFHELQKRWNVSHLWVSYYNNFKATLIKAVQACCCDNKTTQKNIKFLFGELHFHQLHSTATEKLLIGRSRLIYRLWCPLKQPQTYQFNWNNEYLVPA